MEYYEISSESWGKEMELERLAGEKAVVIFSVSTCCMCHAIKRLFCGMGVSPTVYELDHLHSPHLRTQMEKALIALQRRPPTTTTTTTTPTHPPVPVAVAVPVVFVGGRLVGGIDRVMASHINGTLVPLLKEAGALWL